jgi:hypothetical protein
MGVFFLAGAAASGVWFCWNLPRNTTKTVSQTASPATAGLTAATEALLRRLNSPIELRFYSILAPGSISDSLKAFSGRVDELLGRYQQAANGKITVTRCDSQSNSNVNAAIADGIKPFNIEKGDACFLGITVARKGWKESLSSLNPEWEQALEFDLTRAIARAEEASSPTPIAAAPEQTDSEALEAVKRAIPNIASVSLEEGTQILRVATLNEFAAVSQEMETKMKAAEESFTQAQANGSEAGQENARKLLLQLQAEQTDRFKQAVARSQAQIQALQQLKAKK